MTDTPVPFGYNMGWFAVRSEDTDAVVTALKLSRLRKVGWGDGIEAIYEEEAENVLFVGPPVNGWTLVVGRWTMGSGDEGSVRSIERLVTALSSRFGEAQAFATYRVIEYHHWMLAQRGSLVRSFAYLGESGEVLASVGEPTPAERRLTWSSLPQNEWMPDEEDVFKVAGQWSIDPIGLDSQVGPAARGALATAAPLG